MAFQYNKEYVKKDGRRLPGGGPRDLQNKQKVRSEIDQEVIAELHEEVHSLRKQLSKKPASGFTGEQVDQKINGALKQTVEELQSKHEEELKKFKARTKNLSEENAKLKTEIEVLRREIQIQAEIKAETKEEKDKEINKLTTLLTEATEKIERSIASGGITPRTEAPQDPERPKIGGAFIDPAEEMKDVESHIKSKDITSKEKEKTDKKVEKLKGLLGKLPDSK